MVFKILTYVIQCTKKNAEVCCLKKGKKKKKGIKGKENNFTHIYVSIDLLKHIYK